MARDESWLGLAEVSNSTLDQIDARNPSDAIRLDLNQGCQASEHPCNELTSVVLQPVEFISCNNSIISLHPILYNFLVHAAEVANDRILDASYEGTYNKLEHGVSVQLAPLPMEPPVFEDNGASMNHWTLRRVDAENAPNDAQIYISCIYLDPGLLHEQNPDKLTSLLSFALDGRIIMAGTITMLHTSYGFAVVAISKITSTEKDELLLGKNIAYRVKGTKVYNLHITPLCATPSLQDIADSRSDNNFEADIPGYDSLVQDILDMIRLQASPASPSGILVTGCAGVGKTRLVSCVAFHVNELRQSSQESTINSTETSKVHWVSASDLIFHAATEPDLLKNLVLPPTKNCTLWVVDDLHVLGSDGDGSEELTVDVERMLVQTSIIQAIDQLQGSCSVIGIAQEASVLPSELTKVGRLEKQMNMLPPTQWQRQTIWENMIGKEAPSNEIRDTWSTALAPATAGCVAADLCRVFQDAWTSTWARGRITNSPPNLRWEDLSEAARACVPSQLSELDVRKPSPAIAGMSWSEINDSSWRAFGGYTTIKKRAFRHVVSPWKRFLQLVEEENCLGKMPKGLEPPPPGVLFHGPSGCGKTMAANCLAASLGLPMVQVRASDVLDKWLGGSEALLRSLFARARAAAPCILFLDEIDSISSNREEDDTNDVTSRVLSTFLNEMDGVSSDVKQSRVLVIACTNRLNALDPALLRPGRLEEHLFLDLPAVDDLEEILKLRMAQIPLHENIKLQGLAKQLFERGATGADVDGICRDVCLLALRKSSSSKKVLILQQDFNSVIQSNSHTASNFQ